MGRDVMAVLIKGTKEFACCAVMVILFVCHANAQTVNATVGGTVADSSGALLPGATVSATGIDTGIVTKTITNEAGAYQFPSLQAARYRVAAELPGFQEFVYQRVTLGVGAQVRVNFTLSVSAVATTVDVSVETSPLLATSATVGGVIQGQQILDLPLIDQNATSLALTQPQFAGGIGGGVSVAGGGTLALLTTV